ncbi:MAG: SpaA isopeptide-forming pilin-related protein [Defluviitaleaceae bacterium]|nr:SpaA isopeptide-forming pilin-related protein [Defluviitaleaceae bacterium]
MLSIVNTVLDLRAMSSVDNLATEGWAWDSDTKILTVAGLTVDSDTGEGIILPADSTINALDGGISAVNTQDATDTVGIYCEGNLLIKSQPDDAAEMINVAPGIATDTSYGIKVDGNLTIGEDGAGIANPVIIAEGHGTGTANVYGIATENGGNIYILSGTTTGNTTTDGTGDRYAFFADGEIVLGTNIIVTFPPDAALSTLLADENKVVREDGGTGALATEAAIGTNPAGVITFTMSKNGIKGEAPVDGFEFGLFDEGDVQLATTRNDASGLVIFADVKFDTVGDFVYSIKELSGPSGWVLDSAVYTVNISVVDPGSGYLVASISYPDGAPNFMNIRQSDIHGLVQFAEMTFDEVGSFEFTLKELTPSGGGWITDNTEYPIIIHVIDDGHGNLVATAEYPEGFPGFVNEYIAVPARIVISATKRAIGAPLPDGRFEFGLFDKDGTLVATARNQGSQPSPDIVVNNGVLPTAIQPVTGQTPQNSINAAQFTGVITWTPIVVSTFLAETIYTASIKLTAKHGFTLEGVEPSIFTIDIAGVTPSYNDTTQTLEIIFPETEEPSGEGWELYYTAVGFGNFQAGRLIPLEDFKEFDGTPWSGQTIDIDPIEYDPLDYEMWANQPGADGTGTRPVFDPSSAEQVAWDTGEIKPGYIDAWNWEESEGPNGSVLVSGTSSGQNIQIKLLKRGDM